MGKTAELSDAERRALAVLRIVRRGKNAWAARAFVERARMLVQSEQPDEAIRAAFAELLAPDEEASHG